MTPLSVLLAPRLAKQFASNNLSALAPTLVRAARFAFALSMPLLLPFILFGDRLIIYLYGPEFVDSFAPLAILSVGYLLMLEPGSCTNTKHDRIGAENHFCVSSALILNVILNAILIPEYGAVGAAIATTTATIVANSLLGYSCGNRMELTYLSWCDAKNIRTRLNFLAVAADVSVGIRTSCRG